MNAILFAAGNGMRLRPMTKDIHKCLLPVGGKPMLEWWLDAVFASEAFKKVYVNIHHLADQVDYWISHYEETKDVIVERIDERTGLLGTAGTLFWHGDSSEDFMAVYTDTFSRAVIGHLLDILDRWWTEPDETLVGLISSDSPRDSSAALIKTNLHKEVTDFVEKSTSNSGDAWAGIMFGRKEFFGELNQKDRDLARDVLPRLKGKMRIIAHVDAYDIGRGIEYYERFNHGFDHSGLKKAALPAR